MKKIKVVLDSNILIYAINEESKYFPKIRKILEDNRYSFYITTKTISEFVSVLSKLNKYEIIENELPKILSQFKILFPGQKSIHIFQRLVKKYKPVGNRVFDIEIVSIMLSKKLEYLFSFNLTDFEKIAEIKLLE